MKHYILPLMMMASLSSFAGEKGNGGETVDVNNIPRLRDLVEKTTCSWENGASIAAENPLVKEILRRLAQVDWYFAAELQDEILDLDYCLTGPLMKVNTTDMESLVAVYNVKAYQVAIRLNRQVYIDSEQMARMPELDRAMLVIHEAMHTYLSQNLEMRNHKLRSQVKAIYSVFQGNIASTPAFHAQMMNNDVGFPLTVQRLNPLKDAVLFLIGDYAKRREMVLNSASVTSLFNKVKKINPTFLTSWHQPLMQDSALNQIVSQAIAMEDVAVLGKLIKEEALKDDVFSLVYTSPEAQNSEAIKAFILSSQNVEAFAQATLRGLSNRVVSLNADGRIVISGMEIISENGAGKGQPFTSLEAISSKDLHPKMKMFVNFINTLIEQDDETSLARLTYENPQFYAAFTKLGLVEGIKEARSQYELEEGVAIRKVDSLIEGFWTRVKSQVVYKNSEEKWEKFAAKLDATKLGYSIK